MALPGDILGDRRRGQGQLTQVEEPGSLVGGIRIVEWASGRPGDGQQRTEADGHHQPDHDQRSSRRGSHSGDPTWIRRWRSVAAAGGAEGDQITLTPARRVGSTFGSRRRLRRFSTPHLSIVRTNHLGTTGRRPGHSHPRLPCRWQGPPCDGPPPRLVRLRALLGRRLRRPCRGGDTAGAGPGRLWPFSRRGGRLRARGARRYGGAHRCLGRGGGRASRHRRPLARLPGRRRGGTAPSWPGRRHRGLLPPLYANEAVARRYMSRAHPLIRLFVARPSLSQAVCD